MDHYHAIRVVEDDRTSDGFRRIGDPSIGYVNQIDAQTEAQNIIKSGAKSAIYYICVEDCQTQQSSVKLNKDGSTRKKRETKKVKPTKVKGQRKERIAICARYGCKTGYSEYITVDTYSIPLCEKDAIDWHTVKDATLQVRFIHNGSKIDANISNDDD